MGLQEHGKSGLLGPLTVGAAIPKEVMIEDHPITRGLGVTSNFQVVRYTELTGLSIMASERLSASCSPRGLDCRLV